MSIDIYAFLGGDLLDIEARLVAGFREAGFRIALHPEIKLLEPNASACLYISILETPAFLERISPGTPLLVGFAYSPLIANEKAATSTDWPPPKVRKYSYEIQTRSAAGRSTSTYFIQALTAAILASKTKGQFFIGGASGAISGSAGLSKILTELQNMKKTSQWMGNLATQLETMDTQEDRVLLSRIAQGIPCQFDDGAFPFTAWPPLAGDAPYRWPTPIAAPRQTTRSETYKPKKKPPSVFTLMGWGLVLIFAALTFFYS